MFIGIVIVEHFSLGVFLKLKQVLLKVKRSFKDLAEKFVASTYWLRAFLLSESNPKTF